MKTHKAQRRDRRRALRNGQIFKSNGVVGFERHHRSHPAPAYGWLGTMCVKPVGNGGKSLWIDCRKLAVAAVEISLQHLWKAGGCFRG
jgi:hypothetical protein